MIIPKPGLPFAGVFLWLLFSGWTRLVFAWPAACLRFNFLAYLYGMKPIRIVPSPCENTAFIAHPTFAPAYGVKVKGLIHAKDQAFKSIRHDKAAA